MDKLVADSTNVSPAVELNFLSGKHSKSVIEYPNSSSKILSHSDDKNEFDNILDRMIKDERPKRK